MNDKEEKKAISFGKAKCHTVAEVNEFEDVSVLF